MRWRLDTFPPRTRNRPRQGEERYRSRLQLGVSDVARAVHNTRARVPALGEQQTRKALDGTPLGRQVERRREQQRSSIRLNGGLVTSAECEAGSVGGIPDHDLVDGVALGEAIPPCE